MRTHSMLARPSAARKARRLGPLSLALVALAVTGCVPSWSYDAEANAKKIEVEQAYYRHDVFFDTDSTLITARQEARLVDFLQALVATGYLRRIRVLLGQRQPALDLSQLFIAIDDVFDRDTIAELGLLCDRSQRPVSGQIIITLIGTELATQQGKQRGFATTIGAGYADLLPGINL